MAVIKMFNKNDKNRQLMKNINDAILVSQEKTMEIEEMLATAPYVLLGYETLRNILRTVKRTGNLNEAVNTYAPICCPPHYQNSDEQEFCESMNCNQCWLNYIDEYVQPMDKQR